MRGASSTSRLLGLAALLAAIGPRPAVAGGRPSGFEVALHGRQEVLAGRPARFRGVAYRVLGLAELAPLEGALVRARCSVDSAERGKGRPGGRSPATNASRLQDWREVRADRRGFFQIEVSIPRQTLGPPVLELEVGDGRGVRLFSFPLELKRPWTLDLITDRQLYQAGETIHAWARLRDSRSGRPLARHRILFTLTGTSAQDRPVLTDASGVAPLAVPLPAEAFEGSYELIAKVDGEVVRRGYRVGTRTYERLFATVKVTPATARPHEKIMVEVTTTTPSGAPVRNATVEVQVDKEPWGTARTDARGVATVQARAPAYLTHATGAVPISVQVAHPAHGSVAARHSLRLAVPLALEIEAIAPNGGLVPELDGRLYVQLLDGGGEPPPAGTSIEVRGAAVPGGRQRARTDVHGIATVPARLPLGAAAGDGHDSTTTVTVRVEGAAPRTAVVTVPVREDVEVRPTVEWPVVGPGASLQVRLARRPKARKLPAVVELLGPSGLVEARLVPAGQHRVEMRAPLGQLGLMQVRARPLRQRGVVEGTGGLDAFIVRPAHPWFPTLTAQREVHRVRSTAALVLETGPGGPPGWAAVLVRDLAAHSGERPFQLYFLEQSFDRAILDPSTRAAETLLRTALSAHVRSEAAPNPAPALLDALGKPSEAAAGLETSREREVLRDPFPLADELRLRGVGPVMAGLEKLLARALDEGRLDEVTRGRGAARRFRPDLLEELDDVPTALGDEPLTLAMLEEADPSFTYTNVARRVARARLVRLLVALARYLDPGDEATPQQRAAARELPGRWLGRMVERGLIRAEELVDPWGGRFALSRRRGRPSLVVAPEAAEVELVSPGPDGRPGTADDVRDPFGRAVPAGTPYAVASGEDALMERLARLSVDQEVIRKLQEAYKRVASEVAEEEIGDAVGASVSGGLVGTQTGESYGAGGLGLVGTGRGGGGAPTIRVGAASVRGRTAGMAAAGAALAFIVRERFPATLHFAPSIRLNPSGKTVLTVPLSDAVTTYEVEAVVWSAEGWTWSARTRIRVDQEVVVDAPVPGLATAGDLLRLPVRIGNRTPHERRLTLTVQAGTSAPLHRRSGIRVPAGDSVEVPVDLRLQHSLAGHLLFTVHGEDGTPLDASRRPLTVRPAARRVREVAETLASGTGVLRLQVPGQATPREGSEIVVRVGAALFQAPSDREWAAWADAWCGRPRPGPAVVAALRSGTEATLARALAAAWGSGPTAVADRLLSDGLTRLTRSLDPLALAPPAARPATLRRQADILLGLAPIVASGQVGARRKELAASLAATLRALRGQVSSRVAEVHDDPALWATAAAALAWTGPEGADTGRVKELVRRLRRHQLQVGSDTWVAVEQRTDGPSPSALLALAELKLGEKQRAFALLRSLGRQRALDQPSSALGRAAAALLVLGKPPESVNLSVDGRLRRVPLLGGLARVPAPELSRPGSHLVEVESSASSAPIHLLAVSEHGLPWTSRPEPDGPLAVSVEGAAGARDQRARLVMLVRNLSPRTIGAPVLEVGVPAGAELDGEARLALRMRTVAEPDASRGTLRLLLPALPPGGVRRLPLPLRWSVGGRLQGLGVVAYAADRPEDISITPPRVWSIPDRPGLGEQP